MKRLVMATGRPELPTAVMVHDSFGYALMPFIAISHCALLLGVHVTLVLFLGFMIMTVSVCNKAPPRTMLNAGARRALTGLVAGRALLGAFGE